NGPDTSKAITQQSPATSATNKAPATTTAVSSPATVLAPSTIQQTTADTMERFSSNNLLFGGLLLAGILLIAWVVFSEFRRRMSISVYRSPAPATGPSFDALEPEAAVEKMSAPKRLAGGPPQVSLHLKASEPSVRRGAVPFSKTNRGFGTNGGPVASIGTAVENLVPRAPVVESEAPVAEPAVTEPTREAPVAVEETRPANFDREIAVAPDTDFAEFSSVGEPKVIEEPAEVIESLADIPAATEEPILEAPAVSEPVTDETSAWDASLAGEPAWTAPVTPEPAWTPAAFESPTPVSEEPAPVFEDIAPVEPVSEAVGETSAEFESVTEPVASEPEVVPEPILAQTWESEEPVAQGQPIPYQVPAFETESPMAEITKPEPEELPAHLAQGVVAGASVAGVGALRHSVESPSFAPKVISTEPQAQQPTIPATMPQPNQPTPAPSIRPSPMMGAGATPQAQPQSQPQGQAPSSGMQTAVQLTFSFEIASLQLTPSFKMGALQLKPTSKIVTMRLAPSQQPQPAMNLQVTFEISSIQAAGGGIGQIRLTPSQQQRPGVITSPAFNIAGLQLLSGAESGAVQLTPSQQGQASVHVTGRFQIATVEFSPSFEIASLVLNSTSKSVSVQLPGAGPSAVEGAPVFEIANVQITGNGDIGMMQLNAQGAAPKAA
ncbi:MAG: hypothetical protein ACJ8M4_04530, partial [Chthoniobacterales bacterium]